MQSCVTRHCCPCIPPVDTITCDVRASRLIAATTCNNEHKWAPLELQNLNELFPPSSIPRELLTVLDVALFPEKLKSSSASLDISPRILCYPKIHNRVFNSVPYIPTLSQMNPLHALFILIVLDPLNTLRTGLLNCLNARSWGLTFRHRASCI